MGPTSISVAKTKQNAQACEGLPGPQADPKSVDSPLGSFPCKESENTFPSTITARYKHQSPTSLLQNFAPKPMWQRLQKFSLDFEMASLPQTAAIVRNPVITSLLRCTAAPWR
jgi:hypothetical protein